MYLHKQLLNKKIKKIISNYGMVCSDLTFSSVAEDSIYMSHNVAESSQHTCHVSSSFSRPLQKDWYIYGENKISIGHKAQKQKTLVLYMNVTI